MGGGLSQRENEKTAPAQAGRGATRTLAMGRTTRDTVSGWEVSTATWATWQITQSEWFALSEWKWATRSVAPKVITIAQNHPSRSRVTLCLLPRPLLRKIIDLVLSPMSDEPQTKLQNFGKDRLP